MFDKSSENPSSHLSSGLKNAIVDRFISFVDQLRSRTTQPIITGARGLVYGLVVLICSFAILSLLAIGIFRFIENTLPGDSWIAYIACGSLFCLLGTWVWSRRVPKQSVSSQSDNQI
jgi:threonine/homoserine/homoserine lactone efflux protein